MPEGYPARRTRRRPADPAGVPPERITFVEDELRKAASLIPVRPAPGGPEILVLERGSGSRFLPGYVAFPGGAVDDEDEAHRGTPHSPARIGFPDRKSTRLNSSH